MEIAKDRRSALRLAASANTAQVRWSDTGRAGEVKARLVDISLTGALIACDDPAAADRALWLRLREPGASDWVSARVARHVGSGLLAVAFDRPCPSDLMWSATLGIGFGNLLHDDGAALDDGRSRDDWMF
jgi:hypothetical protein